MKTVLLIVCILSSPSAMANRESLTEAVLRNRIAQVSGSGRSVIPRSVVVAVEVTEKLKKVVPERLLEAALKSALPTIGKRIPDLKKRISEGSLEFHDAIAPKVILEVESESSGDSPFEAKLKLTYIEYVKSGEREFSGVPNWTVNHRVAANSKSELEDEILRWIPSNVATINPAKYQEKGFTQAKSPAVTYIPRWVDPERRQNRVYLAATVGAPTLVSLHVGYWGTPSLPIVADLGGMYLNADNRGFQGTLGWAFDNSGSVKQVISATLAGVGETTIRTTNQTDIFGRATATTTETLKSINFYVGPSYRLDWQDLRFEIGAGYGVSALRVAPVRLFFRVGYQFPLGF